MARRATEGNQKPVGGKDAANEWDIEAGFSRARTGASIFPKSVNLRTAVETHSARYRLCCQQFPTAAQ
jgi:hypothetical protein